MSGYIGAVPKKIIRGWVAMPNKKKIVEYIKTKDSVFSTNPIKVYYELVEGQYVKTEDFYQDQETGAWIGSMDPEKTYYEQHSHYDSKIVKILNATLGTDGGNELVLHSDSFKTYEKITDLDYVNPRYTYAFKNAQFVFYNNKIHCLGGGSESLSRNHYSWNGVSWTFESELPYNMDQRTSVVVYNNKIHIMGSVNDVGRSQHYSWDNINGWSLDKQLPESFIIGSSIVYNGKLNILSRNFSHYILENDEWVKIKDAESRDGNVWDRTVIYNNKIYIFGAIGENQSKSIHSYDETNGWTREDNCPYIFSSGTSDNYKPAPVIVLEDIILQPLRSSVGDYYNGCLVYNLYNDNNWLKLDDLPCYDGPSPCISFGDYAYMASWYGTLTRITRDPEYTTINEAASCYRDSDLPTDFSGGPSFIYNNELMIINCNDGNGDIKANQYIYKDEDKSWLMTGIKNIFSNPSYTNAVVDRPVVVYNGYAYMLGGIDQTYSGQTYKNLKRYTYTDASWQIFSDKLPYNFSYGSAVVYNNKIHILGGTRINNVGVGTYHYSWDGSLNSDFEPLWSLPYNFEHGCAIVYHGSIHIFGGSGYEPYMSDVAKKHYKYNNITDRWISREPIPYDFVNGSAVVYDDHIYLIGSSVSGNGKKIYKYYEDSEGNEIWEKCSFELPYNFYYGGAIIKNNRIWLLGGAESKRSKTIINELQYFN